MPTNKQIIMDNITDEGGDNFKSVIDSNYYGIQRKGTLIFPSDCWSGARAQGLSFVEAMENNKDSLFDFLYYFLATFDFDDVNHDKFITEINFSGLWRPDDPYPPHKDGRALDIRSIELNTGDQTTFNNQSGTIQEPGINVFLRTRLFPNQVTQYLSPWWIRSRDPGGGTTDRANDRTSQRDKDHLNHLHLTIPS